MARASTDDPVAVTSLRCPSGVPAGPREVEALDAYDLVLVSSGCFRYRDSRGQTVVDASTGILGSPGQVGETAHPVGGDIATQVLFRPELWHEVTGRAGGVPLQVSVSPAMQLAHRRLLSAAADHSDRMRMEEEALLLLVSALQRAGSHRSARRRLATDRQRRTLVEDAKVLLIEDPDQTLTDLARVLACSPHHLSRVFREATGRTLSGHRQLLRFSRVLDELALQGGDSLADVAVRCGFADHAHLTRTVRRYAGMTPVALRSELSPRDAGPAGLTNPVGS